jgi:hypothetical protein
MRVNVRSPALLLEECFACAASQCSFRASVLTTGVEIADGSIAVVRGAQQVLVVRVSRRLSRRAVSLADGGDLCSSILPDVLRY